MFSRETAQIETFEDEVLTPLDQSLAEALDYAVSAEDAWRSANSYESDLLKQPEEKQQELFPVVQHVGVGTDASVETVDSSSNRNCRKILKQQIDGCYRFIETYCVYARLAAASNTVEEILIKALDSYPVKPTDEMVNDLVKNGVPEEQVSGVQQKREDEVIGIFANASSNWLRFYEGKRLSIATVYAYLEQNPEDIDAFVDWVEDQPRPLTMDTQALFILLGNDIQDKNSDSVSDDFWNKVRSGEISVNIEGPFLHTKLIESRGDMELSASSTAIWLKLIDRTFSGDDEGLIESLLSNIDAWPTEMRSEYEDYLSAYVSSTKQRLEKALEMDVRRSRFEPVKVTNHDIENEDSKALRKPRRQHGGSRVTSRRLKTERLQAHVVEEPRQFAGYTRIVQTPSGYLFEETDHSFADRMLIDYAARHNKDQRVLEDLKAMLASIVLKPHGDGATVYRHAQIRTEDGRPLKLWHLSPSHRQDLHLETDTARRTRIMYAILSVGDNSFRLGLYRIRHHNELANGSEVLRKGKDY